MGLNPFKFIKVLKEMKQAGGMRLCEDCIKRQIDKVTPEDKEAAFQKSMASGMYKTMEDEQPCFVCSSPTKTMVMVGDAMKAIGRASNKKGQR